MNSYLHSSGVMELGTLAAGSTVFALSNPAASGRNVLLKRLAAHLFFNGTSATSRVRFGLARATGTAAGGTSSASGASVGKKNPGNANAVALVTWGPAAITGLTPDGAGDLKATAIPAQVGPGWADELVGEWDDLASADPIVIVPGTSLVIITRDTSVVGSGIGIDVEWNEK